MSAETPLISFRAARLGYPGRVVLEDVTFDIRRGEFWFLLGPNGAGKSTLLRASLGSLAPLAGMAARREGLIRPATIGFVPQRCDLNPNLPTTVREFVSLGLVGARRDVSEPEALARALEQMALTGLERRSYWSLSGGQRQRALIARALIRRPSLLLVDEPTTGLDLASQNALMERVDNLNRVEGLTVLFVTHDLALAATHATHVALFYGGGVDAGPARDVLASARIRRVYGLTVDSPSRRATSAGALL